MKKKSYKKVVRIPKPKKARMGKSVRMPSFPGVGRKVGRNVNPQGMMTSDAASAAHMKRLMKKQGMGY